jgi:DNA-binding NarL/FixJ family response regulator
MIGVLVVDDAPYFRQVAREVVDATPGFEPIGEAESGEEALRLVKHLEPQLVLLDVRMPGMDGIETARTITAESPHPTVVLISVDELHSMPAKVESCGAATFLRKRELCSAALRRVWEDHGGHG